MLYLQLKVLNCFLEFVIPSLQFPGWGLEGVRESRSQRNINTVYKNNKRKKNSKDKKTSDAERLQEYALPILLLVLPILSTDSELAVGAGAKNTISIPNIVGSTINLVL